MTHRRHLQYKKEELSAFIHNLLLLKFQRASQNADGKDIEHGHDVVKSAVEAEQAALDLAIDGSPPRLYQRGGRHNEQEVCMEGRMIGQLQQQHLVVILVN